MIHLPKHLTKPLPYGRGLETPEDMPFIELAARLADIGYRLVNTGNGDLRAEPIKPCEHLSLVRDDGQWECVRCETRLGDADVLPSAICFDDATKNEGELCLR
jgi:hypothetical protein